jgi:cytochrome P450
LFNDAQDTTLIHDLEKIMMLTGLGVEFNLWLFVKYFPVPGIGNFKKILARMQGEGYRAVAATKNSSKGSSHTLFSKMVPEDGSEAPLPDTVVANEAIGDIVAGSDTSVAGIVYMIYAVLGHPDIKKKLEEELATCSETPGWDELEGKEYLNWVIDEGLRLYPPAPSSLPRKVPDKGAVLGGYKLPRGCVVSTQALTIQRDPVAFPNPEEFIPERWKNATPEMKDHFVAFGGSMRCKS